LKKIHPFEMTSLNWLKRKKVSAASGIGRPELFEQTLQQCGAHVESVYRAADHGGTLEEVRGWMAAAPADRVFVVTRKDAVRWQLNTLSPVFAKRTFVLEMKLSVSSSHREWNHILQSIENGILKFS